jgi:hypothetical protein
MSNTKAIGVAFLDQAIVGGSIDGSPIGATTPSTVAATALTGTSISSATAGTPLPGTNPLDVYTPVAVNATATLTAAQVASGYITSTSAAAVTMTMPTGTLLGTLLGAKQGYTYNLYIDNTAGANTVTIAVGVNAIISAAAAAGGGAGAGLLTVPSGVTGQACFTLMFSSATAYTFSRSA